MVLSTVILYPFPTTTVSGSIAFRLEAQRLREYQSDLPESLEIYPNAPDGYCTNFDEVTECKSLLQTSPIPSSYRRTRLLNEDLMMQQREQDDLEQGVVTPSSPTLHSFVFPCHLSFSFPRAPFREVKLCLASTRSLQQRASVIIRDQR